MNASNRLLTRTGSVLVIGALLSFARVEMALGQPPRPDNPAMKTDMDVFHYLLTNRKDVKRTVKILDNGVETLTESENAEVTKKIQEHVEAMHKRVKDGKGIHLRDPLFAEIFKNYDKVVMKVEKTNKGVKVTETSTDAYVAKLIQAHAAVVTKFIENGHTEVRQNHPVPAKEPTKK